MIPGLPDSSVLSPDAFQRCADRASADPEVSRLHTLWLDAQGSPDEAAAYARWMDAYYDRIRAVFRRGLDG
jgi:hypothetical protein